MLTYLRLLLAARLPVGEERGASAVEYGLLISGVAALVVVVVFAFGDNVADLFTDTCTSVAGTTTCDQD